MNISKDPMDHIDHFIAIHPSKTTGVEHLVCHDCEVSLVKFQPCEVYSRCVGYLRPVSGWNKGKRQEFSQRKTYALKEGEKATKSS